MVKPSRPLHLFWIFEDFGANLFFIVNRFDYVSACIYAKERDSLVSSLTTRHIIVQNVNKVTEIVGKHTNKSRRVYIVVRNGHLCMEKINEYERERERAKLVL